MATTVTPSTLTVQIKEEITLGGTSYDQTVTNSIADIATYSKRILTINAGTSHVVAQFGDNTVNDLYDVQDVKYIRITNLDDTNSIIVTASGDNEAGAIELNPQESFQMFNGKVSGATAKAAITSVDDIESIYVHNATGGADIELVIATV
jgi:hypothetical protein